MRASVTGKPELAHSSRFDGNASGSRAIPDEIMGVPQLFGNDQQEELATHRMEQSKRNKSKNNDSSLKRQNEYSYDTFAPHNISARRSIEALVKLENK